MSKNKTTEAVYARLRNKSLTANDIATAMNVAEFPGAFKEEATALALHVLRAHVIALTGAK